MKPKVRSITRIQAEARGFDGKHIMNDVDYRIARQLFRVYPGADVVDISNQRWNTRCTRYHPAERHVIYVKGRGKRYVGTDCMTPYGDGHRV